MAGQRRMKMSRVGVGMWIVPLPSRFLCFENEEITGAKEWMRKQVMLIVKIFSRVL
jgi:hypothetical protein